MTQITKLELHLSLVVTSEVMDCEEEHTIAFATINGLKVNTDLLHDLICEHLQELLEES